MMSLVYPVDRLDWALFSVEIFSIIGTDFVSLWQWFWSSRCKPSITSILVGLWQFISRSQGQQSSLRKILIQPNQTLDLESSSMCSSSALGETLLNQGGILKHFLQGRCIFISIFLWLREKGLNSIIVGIKITICFGIIKSISWLLGENFRCPLDPQSITNFDLKINLEQEHHSQILPCLMQVVFEAEYDSQSGLFGLDNLVFGTEKKCIPR